jgi:hypothetical protein
MGLIPEWVNQRRDICQSCEWYFKQIQGCRKCGCFIPTKSLIPTSRCPLEKWTSQ